MQKDIFLSKEGNQWYNRNKSLKDIPIPVKNILLKYIKNEDKVLEIGCSDGRNLDYINKTTGAHCYGVDPSDDAVKDGNIKYENLNLAVGTADNLQFNDDYFDIVIFGFCLYLIDSKLLLKSLSEADRVLKDGGNIISFDFDTKIPKKRTYRHCEGVFTHKYDYNKIFESIPFYYLVEKNSFSHYGNEFHIDPKERLSISVLYKEINNAYVIEEDI